MKPLFVYLLGIATLALELFNLSCLVVDIAMRIQEYGNVKWQIFILMDCTTLGISTGALWFVIKYLSYERKNR